MADRDTLVRVQAVNTLRDVLCTRIDDGGPGWSYRRCMARIAREGHGAMVLIGQSTSAEQRLAEVLHYPAPLSVTGQSGASTAEEPQNYRAVGTGSQILKRLGIGRMRLMSAPIHFNALSGFDLTVTDFVQPDD